MFARVHADREVRVSMPAGSGNPRRRRAKAKKRAKNFLEKEKRFPGSAWQMAWKIGKEDPRRVIYALKVGVSLTLVSLLFLMEPLFEGIGQNAIWAVMTVILVLEFTAGATLCKGLNRGFGTLLAGSLGYYIQYVVNNSNRIFHAFFIAVAVFSDSYRVENVMKIAHERLYTIALGCAICLLMSPLIFPHWSGEDLHNSTVSKLEGLAKSIEACVDEYFEDTKSEYTDEESTKDDDDKNLIYEGYKAVLDSKSNDESMTPRPVRALFKNPYTRLSGEVSRVFMELDNSIRNRCRFSSEIFSDDLHEALKDLNTAMKSPAAQAVRPTPRQDDDQQQVVLPHDQSKSNPDYHHDIRKLPVCSSKRENMLKKQSSKIAVTGLEFSEALPLAAFASLLVEAVAKLDPVIEEVKVLGKMACYSKESQSSRGSCSHDENENKNDTVE